MTATENLFENLLPRVEEKMMNLLTELEDARKLVQRLTHENTVLEEENASLKAGREVHARKLMDLLSLLDTVSQNADHLASTAASLAPTLKPVLVQDQIVQEKIGSGSI